MAEVISGVLLRVNPFNLHDAASQMSALPATAVDPVAAVLGQMGCLAGDVFGNSQILAAVERSVNAIDKNVQTLSHNLSQVSTTLHHAADTYSQTDTAVGGA